MTKGIRSRSLLLSGEYNGKKLPTSEELAMRPELVKLMLNKVVSLVDEQDTEHAVVIAITPDGTPSVFHSYGESLALEDVASLLEDLATMAREQSK